MRSVFCVLAMACAFAAATVGPAAAAGSSGNGQQTLTATCTVLGTVTVRASSGQSAWVGSTHYVVLRLSGTFTPTGGTAQSFTKTYGMKNGFGQTYTCTGSQSDASGTFSFTATVARTPTH
jgi:hypothetical protein